MKRLFLSVAVLFLLSACSSTIIPQIGGVAPCQIQSIEPVEQAILAALTDQHWEVITASPNIIEARKKLGQLQTTVEIAYGYRGFSIEYQDSQGMGYDPEDDTIGSTYFKWVNALAATIHLVLTQEAKSMPPVKCSDKKPLG